MVDKDKECAPVTIARLCGERDGMHDANEYLRKEIAKLLEEKQQAFDDRLEVGIERNKLLEENKRLREVLEYYARKKPFLSFTVNDYMRACRALGYR